MALKGYQRSFLIKKSHALSPVVMIGKAGVTDSVIETVKQALLAHELIKVRFVDHKDSSLQLSVSIAEATYSALVIQMGNTAVFFKRHPDEKKRVLHVPKR